MAWCSMVTSAESLEIDIPEDGRVEKVFPCDVQQPPGLEPL
jgi:hypothetical protein